MKGNVELWDKLLVCVEEVLRDIYGGDFENVEYVWILVVVFNN